MYRFIRDALSFSQSLVGTNATSTKCRGLWFLNHIFPWHQPSRCLHSPNKCGKVDILEIWKNFQKCSHPTRFPSGLSVSLFNRAKKTGEKLHSTLFKIMPAAVLTSSGLYCSFKFLDMLDTVEAAAVLVSNRNFIADIVAKAGPAVVFIEIKGR